MSAQTTESKSGISYRDLGKMVRQRMASGLDRKDAIEAVLEDITVTPEMAQRVLQSAGYQFLAQALRHYKHSEKGRQNGNHSSSTNGTSPSSSNPQPSQFDKDKNDGRTRSETTYPAGSPGEWKAPSEYTRADVRAQLASWRATVRGLEPRIEAGEYLVDTMYEDEVVTETIDRVGKAAERKWLLFAGELEKVE